MEVGLMGGNGARRGAVGLIVRQWGWQDSSEAQRSAMGLLGELWG